MQETQNNILGVAVGGLAGAILPTKESKDNIRIAAPAEAVLKTVSGILKDAQCLTDEFPGSSPGLRLSVLVRSGFLKLNPTIIHVQVSRDSEASSTVSITAAAKEGLVNQHSAEKAIAWLKDALLLAYPSR